MSAQGVTYEQIHSAAMSAVDQAKESMNQIESQFPQLSDFPAFELKNDGIDLGRNGNVTPWSQTPWSSGFDFREKTTVTVSGIQFPEETLKITARPDHLNRGIGWKFNVINTETGESPPYIGDVLIKSIEGNFGLREKMSNFVENNYSHLKDGGGSDPSYPGMEVLEELKYGWVLVEAPPENDGGYTSQIQNYLVIGQRDGSRVYLNGKGEIVDDEYRFNAENMAKTAYNRWLDRQERLEVEVVERLEYGWVIAVERPNDEYLVSGQQGGSRVYLNSQGEVVSDKNLFPSKSRARRAFRRWRDRREGNISEARSELNETMRERAEQFETLEEQQESKTNVVTESNIIEGETKVVEGDSRTISTRASGAGGSRRAAGGSVNLPAIPDIPVAVVAAVVLGTLYLALSGSEGET